MSAAPVGAIVGIYYDARVELAVGHHIRTGTGRLYRVVSLRRQATGKHIGRWHLRCLVVDDVPADAVVHQLRWYRRGTR